MNPIDRMFSTVDWKALPPSEPGDIPHATHEGSLRIGTATLRCYQLSDGRRIFDAADVARFLSITTETVRPCPVCGSPLVERGAAGPKCELCGTAAYEPEDER